MSVRRVAVIGASADRNKFGNKAVRAFLHQGYQVFPVNPRGGTIEGLPVFRSVREIDEPVEMASMYVHPDVGIALLDELAAAGIKEVWLNPGAESPALVRRAWVLGLQPIVACSIVGIGESPGAY
jgi:predicted CoA-binding protein